MQCSHMTTMYNSKKGESRKLRSGRLALLVRKTEAQIVKDLESV